MAPKRPGAGQSRPHPPRAGSHSLLGRLARLDAHPGLAAVCLVMSGTRGRDCPATGMAGWPLPSSSSSTSTGRTSSPTSEQIRALHLRRARHPSARRRHHCAGGMRNKDGSKTAWNHVGQVTQETKIPDSVIRIMRHKSKISRTSTTCGVSQWHCPVREQDGLEPRRPGHAGRPRFRIPVIRIMQPQGRSDRTYTTHPAVLPAALPQPRSGVSLPDAGGTSPSEPFCGSGTTLLAAEAHCRKAAIHRDRAPEHGTPP